LTVTFPVELISDKIINERFTKMSVHQPITEVEGMANKEFSFCILDLIVIFWQS
jgi:hypothetical protein